jgi:sugar/nucleoside kinase (ribokinase family)
LALKKLGINFTFHGVIGEDKHGEFIKKYLKELDIPFFYDVCETGTERHVNLMKNDTWERLSIFLTEPPASIELNVKKVEQLIIESDIIFLNIAPYCKRFIPLIKKHKKEIWCDLHSYDGRSEYHDDFIKEADILLFSSERNPQYRKSMKSFIELGAKLTICTHGPKGSSTLLPSGEWIELPALNYDVVDTNGAGDSFFVGFLYGYLKGYSIRKSLEIATIIGGLAVTSKELIFSELSEDTVLLEYSKWRNNNC